MTEKKNEKFSVSIRSNRIDVSRKDGSFHASILAVYADHRFTDSHHDEGPADDMVEAQAAFSVVDNLS